jgi:hypothetical protein
MRPKEAEEQEEESEKGDEAKEDEKKREAAARLTLGGRDRVSSQRTLVSSEQLRQEAVSPKNPSTQQERRSPPDSHHGEPSPASPFCGLLIIIFFVGPFLDSRDPRTNRWV